MATQCQCLLKLRGTSLALDVFEHKGRLSVTFKLNFNPRSPVSLFLNGRIQFYAKISAAE
eukprot:1650424-Rhodomonas_salina.4